MSRPVEIRVPGKVILFGEWGVTRGFAGLATAVAKDFHASWTPGTYAGGLRLSGGGFDASFPNPSAFADAATRAEEAGFLRFAVAALARARGWQPGRVFLRMDWRASDGLGSSSATVAATLGLTHVLAETPAAPAGDLFASDPDRFVKEVTGRRGDPGSFDAPTLRRLWLEGREILRRLDSPRASGLDLATQLAGGSLVLRGEHWEAPSLSFPSELAIVHTGQKASTRDWLARFEPDNAWFEALGRSTEDFLGHRDWERAIREHAELFAATPLVPDFVKEFTEAGQSAGWLRALKTTGAGGGDALLCLVHEARRADFESAVRTRGWELGPAKPEAFQAKGLELA